MSYFDIHQLNREFYKNTLNLSPYFSKKIKGLYNEEDEYVVLWYDYAITNSSSKSFVQVKFINLTKPTYTKNNTEYQSFLIVKVPINYLHKIAFGSIWKNGKSTERFVLEQYTITINQDRKNLSFKSLAYASYNNQLHPFECSQYFHLSNESFYLWDKNQLLNIKQFAIHPLQFFMAYYGYSSEIKRILTTYNWDEIENKLRLKNKANVGVEKYVILPRNFSQKDAIFLYHLKYDEYTRSVVKQMSNEIMLSKEQHKGYKVPCWHDQPLTLTFRGIRLGDSVLCSRITGISQPQGDPINIILEIKQEKQKGVISDSQNAQYKTVVKQYNREYEFDELDISLNPVNNLVTTSVIEQLAVIGAERQLNAIQKTQAYTHNSNITFIPYKEATDFSVGDQHGLGNTGISNCFYDVPNDGVSDEKTRLDKVWEHAIRLRYDKGVKVY